MKDGASAQGLASIERFDDIHEGARLDPTCSADSSLRLPVLAIEHHSSLTWRPTF
ncbi:hypothetical protein [Caldimonas mangrovi]|uniref:hypothetical protein n=1 Tax=Caldimonas mangrovi TaxID=2944811 RepID=UPI0020443D8B|nr:hypothetical protein [Caldimonas mangrovi]